MTFGPPAKFCRILISRLIFFFLTGFKTLTMHFWPVWIWKDSKTCQVSRAHPRTWWLTSEYLPRPTFRTIS